MVSTVLTIYELFSLAKHCLPLRLLRRRALFPLHIRIDRKSGGSYCPQPIHVAFDAIFVGASRIAKRVCFALEVTPDFVRLASRAAVTAAVKPKTLATRKTPPQKNAPLKKQVSGESKNPRNG